MKFKIFKEYRIFCRVFGEKHWCTQVYSINFELFHLMGLLYCFVGLKKSVFWEENSWFTSIQALAQPCTLLFKAFNDCWGIFWAGFGEKNNIILEHYAVILRLLESWTCYLSKFYGLFFFFFFLIKDQSEVFIKRKNYGTFLLFCLLVFGSHGPPGWLLCSNSVFSLHKYILLSSP